MSAHTFAVPMVAPDMMAVHQQQVPHFLPANGIASAAEAAAGMAADAPVAHTTAAATATLSTDYAS